MSRFQIFLHEGKGDTSLTTVSHELAVAIFLAYGDVPLNTGADIAKYLYDPKSKIKAAIATENRDVAPISVDQIKVLPQARFFTEDTLLKPDIIKDAKNLASKIKDVKAIGKPTGDIYWTGPTNDGSKYGAADITVKTSKGIQPISLKKGKGQLKNLGLKKFSESLLKGIVPKGGDFSSILYGKGFINLWNQLTRDWISLQVNTLRGNRWRKLSDIVLSYSSLSYNAFQKQKVTAKEAKEFKARELYKDKDKLSLKKILSRVYEKLPAKSWGALKEQIFGSIFKRFFDGHEQQLNENLIDTFKYQISSGEEDLWYAAEGGKKILFIPNEDTFARTSDGLEFTYSHKSTPAGYIFTLYIKSKISGAQLAIIEIYIRWKFGQMVDAVSTASNLKKVQVDDWNKIFKV